MTGHGTDYRWNLRDLMADRGITSTTELNFRLRGLGVELSPVQVSHLVTDTPERLSVRLMLALCDILDCTSAQLIEPAAGPVDESARRPISTPAVSAVPAPRTSPPVLGSRVRGLA